MSLPKPGEYITAKCGRCNDITGHIVMLVLDGEIARVECKACGSMHKYRESKVARPGKATGGSVRRVRAGDSRENAVELGPARSSRSTPAKGTSTKVPAKRASAAKIEAAWDAAMLRLSGQTPEVYSMHASFARHCLIEHPVFGKGEVIAVSPPDKIDVLFQQGVKTLRCKV